MHEQYITDDWLTIVYTVLFHKKHEPRVWALGIFVAMSNLVIGLPVGQSVSQSVTLSCKLYLKRKLLILL